MIDSSNNFIQAFNELVVLTCIWLMFHYTQFVGDPNTRYDLSEYFLNLMAIDAAVNVLFMVFAIGRKIYRIIRDFYRKR